MSWPFHSLKIQVARATSLSSHMVFKCQQTPTIFFQKKYSRITPPSISLIFQIPITLPVQWVYLLSNNSTCTITLPFKLAFPCTMISLDVKFQAKCKVFLKVLAQICKLCQLQRRKHTHASKTAYQCLVCFVKELEQKPVFHKR